MNNHDHETECICGDDIGGIKAYIQIYYGPYVSWGILRHRTQRLKNLLDALEAMGHTVDLIPTKFWDRVEINICGRTIHRMRLTNLEINPESMKSDPICRQAIRAVIETLTRMNKSNIKEGAPHAALVCRTVRIGSYICVPKERVIISASGIKLEVPLLEDSTNSVTLEIKFEDIVKVLVHFGEAMPVLFIHTTNVGCMIREMLGMQDPDGVYYDPVRKDQSQRRITLLPEVINEGSKLILKALFKPNKLLGELNSRDANNILVRSSPKDFQRPILQQNQQQSQQQMETNVTQPRRQHLPQTDSESGSDRNLTFLQESIDNPQNSIVQRQINGNTAKMLVILQNGEQRFITFDIPNEDCTVQDLLEQANIPICPETSISLVTDETLQINERHRS